jgi:hypothetical protein
VAAAEELYKQMIPDLNSTLPADANPTWKQLAALGVKLKGAVLIGHSESGFFPEQAALVDPSGIRGMVSIEQPCVTNFTPVQLAGLAKIPTLVMFGDHLGFALGVGGLLIIAGSFIVVLGEKREAPVCASAGPI